MTRLNFESRMAKDCFVGVTARMTRLLPFCLTATRRGLFAGTALTALAAGANAQWVVNPATGHEYRLTEGAYWGASDTSVRSLPDWWDAEAEAVANGGHLVTINDDAENSWVVDTFGLDAFWIGLTDWGSEGSFYWISGEPVTYLNWDAGQPDNAHAGGEDTVHINHPFFGVIGYWNDLGAQGNSPYHPNPYRGIIERVPGGTNSAPVATDDFYGMDQASSLSVPSPGVLANDSDPDEDPLTVELVTGPANADAFQLNPDGSFSYTPLPYFYGEDTFTYKAYDGTASSEIATVHITVSQPGSQGFITGGGKFFQDGRKCTFGFVAKVEGNGVQGNLEFQDHDADLDMESESVEWLYAANQVDGSFSGTCKVNGAAGYTFFVGVHDQGQPGSNDDMTIWVLDPSNSLVYSAGGLLTGGNIVIHGN